MPRKGTHPNGIGPKLNVLIYEKKCSKSEFARGIGVHPCSVSDYFANRRMPAFDIVERMARFFGKDLNYFASAPFDIEDEDANSQA